MEIKRKGKKNKEGMEEEGTEKLGTPPGENVFQYTINMVLEQSVLFLCSKDEVILILYKARFY